MPFPFVLPPRLLIMITLVVLLLHFVVVVVDSLHTCCSPLPAPCVPTPLVRCLYDTLYFIVVDLRYSRDAIRLVRVVDYHHVDSVPVTLFGALLR